MEDQTIEEFDPASYLKNDRKYDPLEKISEYVSQHFQRCLNQTTRRKLAREHPQPSIPTLTPPATDDAVIDFLHPNFPKHSDDTLRSLQAAVLAGAIPLVNLWASLQEENALASPGAKLDQIGY